METVLEVRSLEKSFSSGFLQKKSQVLKKVSFSLREGVTTGFVGANGSGKTTTIKCLFEFIFPESGEIKFWNQDFSEIDRSLIGYLPERPYLYEFLSVHEFLKFHWDLCFNGQKSGFEESAQKVLKQVKLDHVGDRKMRHFSKGMLQRAGIAQAILTEPKLLILDEPMSGLDPDGRLMVKNILQDEKKKGTTLFFSSHLLQDMEELCEDLVIIEKGEIIYRGLLATFKQQYRTLEEAFKAAREKGTL